MNQNIRNYCKRCDMYYPSYYKFTNHIKKSMIHVINLKKEKRTNYYCSICDISFETDQRLRHHFMESQMHKHNKKFKRPQTHVRNLAGSQVRVNNNDERELSYVRPPPRLVNQSTFSRTLIHNRQEIQNTRIFDEEGPIINEREISYGIIVIEEQIPIGRAIYV